MDLSQLAINFTSLNTLQQRFYQFVDDFNNQQWDDLANNVLDDNVLVVGIDHPEAHHFFGIVRVIKFLRDSHGHFDPLAPFFQVFGEHGYVIGVGNWSDREDPHDGPLLFSFIFANRSSHNNPEWKAIRLWASRPLGDVKP